MLARHDIGSLYHIVNGIIYTRGEFYLEREYIPYFWSKYIEGKSRYRNTRDSWGNKWYVFTVSEKDCEIFPELKAIKHVGVRQDGESIVSWIESWT